MTPGDLHAGLEVGPSAWIEVPQARIDAFAEATDDRQSFHVRFPALVPAGSRVRASFRVDEVEQAGGGVQATMTATVEREGGDRPVCVAEVIFRYLP